MSAASDELKESSYLYIREAIFNEKRLSLRSLQEENDS